MKNYWFIGCKNGQLGINYFRIELHCSNVLDLNGKNSKYVYYTKFNDGVKFINCVSIASSEAYIVMNSPDYEQYNINSILKVKKGMLLISNDEKKFNIAQSNLYNSNFFKLNYIISDKGPYKLEEETDHISYWKIPTDKQKDEFNKLLDKFDLVCDKNKYIIYKKYFLPNIGELYYFIDNDGIVYTKVWYNDINDNFRYNCHNCFKTAEKANFYKNKFDKILMDPYIIYEQTSI